MGIHTQDVGWARSCHTVSASTRSAVQLREVEALSTPRPGLLALPGPGPCRALLLLSLLGLTVVLVLRFGWNEDAWWYVTSGRAVLASGGIPSHDVVLHPGIKGWMTSSWLWTVLLALADRIGGPWGVVGLTCAIACGTTALLFFSAGSRARFGLLDAAVCLLYLLEAGMRISIKAELVTWLLTVSYLHLLDGRRVDGRRASWRLGALLLALQLLWGNLHAGFPLGIVIFLCFAVGDWIEGRIARARSSPAPVALGMSWWFALPLAAASCLSPGAVGSLSGTVDGISTLRAASPVTSEAPVQVMELLPTFSTQAQATPYRLLYGIAFGLGLIGFLVGRETRRPARLLLFVLMAFLGASAVRFVHGFALVSGFVTLRNIARPSPWLARVGERFRGARTRALLSLIACTGAATNVGLSACLLWATSFQARQSSDVGFGCNPMFACPGVARYIHDHEIPGPIFNDEALGGYLAYALWPERKVFVDTRHLDNRRLHDYHQAFASMVGWEEVQAAWNFEAVVLSNLRGNASYDRLRSGLARDPRWRLAFLDSDCVLFVSRQRTRDRLPVARNLREEGAFVVDSSSTWQGVATEVDTLFGGAVRALGMLQLDALFSLKQWDSTIAMCDAMLRGSPGNVAVLQRRAFARYASGRLEQALEDCQAVVTSPRGNLQAVVLLGNVLLGLGRVEEAARVVDELLEQVPLCAEAQDLRRRIARLKPVSPGSR